MAAPLQTWESLGSMAAEQRDFTDQTAEYLERNEVYDLFSDLLRQVIIHQPEDPKKFMQEQLRVKPPLSVCIIGPPGINRSKYCAQVAEEFGVAHIHIGKLLRDNKELTDVIESGALVDDSIVISTLKAELAKHAGKGWVLDGFPRTKLQAQALALKETGFCLDKVLLLYTGNEAIRQRYAAKVAAAGYRADEAEDVINTRLQQYQRHVISICELFKNIIRRIEVGAGDDSLGLVLNTIKGNLHIRPYSNAPMRSHRICIVGPCASGRTTQCKAIARTYGLVHVDVAKLLLDCQQASGTPIEEVPPEHVGDEELCALVGRRLNEIDCLRKGWILDGFPKTKAQASFLRTSHLWPTRLVRLKLTEEEVVSRIATRRVDPVTQVAYYRSPNSVAVRQRLIQADYDHADAAQERVRLHEQNVDVVLNTFPVVSSTVDAMADAPTVTRIIQERVDTLLPSEKAGEDA